MKLITSWIYLPVVFVLSKNVSTPSLVRDRDNFPIEEHSLKTSDGYYLTIFRINFLEPSDKPVVLLMHGLFGSSDDYVVNGAERSLAQILAADGFDVWLGNSRGNKYCKKHDFLSSLDPRFWSFEWHDIAMKDLPAIINYVLETSKADKLSYVGHSQGGTIFLVLNSMDPQFGKKTIRSAHLLAPACFVGNARTELRALAPILGASNILGTSFGAEVLAESPLLEVVCKGRNYDSLCVNLINLFGGFDYTLVNETLIDDILGSIPSGASWKQVQHFFQGTRSKNFQQFDYGFLGNMVMYRSSKPPQYHLENIEVPVVFYIGDKDELVTVVDSQTCFNHMNTEFAKDFKVIENMDHMNFVYAWEAKNMVYDEVLKDIRNFL